MSVLAGPGKSCFHLANEIAPGVYICDCWLQDLPIYAACKKITMSSNNFTFEHNLAPSPSQPNAIFSIPSAELIQSCHEHFDSLQQSLDAFFSTLIRSRDPNALFASTVQLEASLATWKQILLGDETLDLVNHQEIARAAAVMIVDSLGTLSELNKELCRDLLQRVDELGGVGLVDSRSMEDGIEGN